MSLRNRILNAESFIFGEYAIDKKESIITFTYYVKFKGLKKARKFYDKLVLGKIPPESWNKIPDSVLKTTLESLLIMLGINYWCVFPTKNIQIKNFKIDREQAKFWNSLYLNGLGEFFYDMQMDFRNIIDFPYADSFTPTAPATFKLPKRAILLNGAGKDSILSAEILKSNGATFDFFSFAPTPAHKRIEALVGAKTIEVNRIRDPWVDFITSIFGISSSYPSVSTFTFVAVLIAELLGYDSIVFSNERSADFGNLTYLGLLVNHQWCKSSEAEKMINDYIQSYITRDISTYSLLRKYSELEIVRRFVKYPKYLHQVTSCNAYFWLPKPIQFFVRKSYWCNKCPKCVFLFACFSAFLPKQEVVSMFGANLYNKNNLLPTIRRILGVESFKPLECVGEPEEMILAMHYATLSKEYKNDLAIRFFENKFPLNYNYNDLEKKILEI